MKHLQYRREVKGSPCAFLFVHGFLGTPDHFKPLLSLLPESVSVYNLRLAGHGKDPKAFAHTSMACWERQVEEAVKELLKGHDRVYIVAHSMGTLFAIDESRKQKCVAGLFLLAVPVKLRLKPKILIRSMKVCFDRATPDDPWELAAKRCYGLAPDPNPLHYLGWLPRVAELFWKIYCTKKYLPHLKTPCAVLLSGLDELVSPASCASFQGNPRVHTVILPSSGHYYYPPEDLEGLLSAFREFVREAGV